MKKIFLIIVIIVVQHLNAQQSVNAAGGNGTGSGGSFSYTVGQIDYTFASGSNGSVSMGVQHPLEKTTLNLTSFIQAYMSPGANPTTMVPVLLNSGVSGATATQCDTITIELHNPTTPYALAYTYKGILKTDGTIVCTYPVATLGNTYYIVTKHRNALETWSVAPITFASSTIAFNISGQGAVYGGNTVLVSGSGATGIYALYSGDIDHDGEILPFDKDLWEVDYLNLLSGYWSTDLDGDGEVLPFDKDLWEANYLNLISVLKP